MATNDSSRYPASFEHLFDREHCGETGLSVALLAAVTIHLAVFAITWPTLGQSKIVEPTTRPHDPFQSPIGVDPAAGPRSRQR